MGQNSLPSDELRDMVPFSRLVKWMNAQPRRPGEERTDWRHENARQQLEILGLRFYQRGPGCHLFFRVSELADVAPMLCARFLAGGAEEPQEERYQPA